MRFLYTIKEITSLEFSSSSGSKIDFGWQDSKDSISSFELFSSIYKNSFNKNMKDWVWVTCIFERWGGVSSILIFYKQKFQGESRSKYVPGDTCWD